MSILAWIFAGFVVASLGYCILAVIAALSYLAARAPSASKHLPITIMKPLSGLDDGLRENLRSYFDQDYRDFELLLAVRSPTDPAARIAREVMDEFPSVPARLIVVGDSLLPNAKVFSLQRMEKAARHEILVMTDSDTRVGRRFLKTMAAEISDPRVGLITCPYYAVAGTSFWSKLEAIGLNTEFLAGVLIGRFLLGMDFALGPAIVIRRAVLDGIGGFAGLQNYLAEDFVMGNLVAAAGYRVILSSYKIEHRIGSQELKLNLSHRLRWARSTRRSRPVGYIGQLLTYPFPLALLLIPTAVPALYPLAAALLLRAATAWVTTRLVLRRPLTPGQWLLLPFQDLISFGIWISGFFGRTVKWRERTCLVEQDGTYAVASMNEPQDV